MFSVKLQGAVDVVQMGGPLNHENAEQLVETVQSGLAEGQPMVVLDMSDVTLLDSAGLDALLDSRDVVLLKGGTVKLAAITQLCTEVLRVTEVGSHFESYKEVKTAVGSFVQ
jgi:anti-sigma B factor antagonist